MDNPSKTNANQIKFIHSFRGVMLFLFLAIAIIPTVILGAVSYITSQQALQSRIQDEFLRTAKIQAAQVDSWIDTKMGELKAIAKTKRILSLDPTSAKEALNGYIAEWSDYELLFATDTSGKTFATTDGKEYQLQDRDYWKTAM